MTIYAIGDVHGADDLLARLLDRLDERGDAEQLWFVGDLVNRGPDSLGVLRRVRSLGERAVTVLGNHDLSLLALARDPERHASAPDALKPILTAPDREALLDWLQTRPLIHHDSHSGWLMVHAGIPAEWDVAEAKARASELEARLRGENANAFLAKLFGNTPAQWSNSLDGMPRLRYIANALTRQRFVTSDASLDMEYKKTLAKAPRGLTPWFAYRPRATLDQPIVFGHWSALEDIAWPGHNAWGIDTGAAWGGQLTAMSLTASPELIQVSRDTD